MHRAEAQELEVWRGGNAAGKSRVPYGPPLPKHCVRGYGPPLAVCRRLAASDLPFDQLIYEGTWTHIGIAPPGTLARREVLTAHFANGKATYTRGLPA